MRRYSPRRLLAVCAAVGMAGSVAGCAVAGTPAVSAPGKPSATERPAPSWHTTAAIHRQASSPASAPASPARRDRRLLSGKVIGIDAGHNGLNHTDPAYLNHLIWNGREREACDTSGTQTASGYTEALFNFNVAVDLRAYLRRDGSKVVMTRQNNHGLGPCVNKRSQIINAAHADVAIDIHADGGPSWGRGFTVLEPVADGPNDGVVAPSLRLGRYVHRAFLSRTPMRTSDYYGHNGYMLRDDLAGLNLTTVPKVLIECGNMTNAADAALLTSPAVQHRIARALEAAIIRYLTGTWPARGARR